MSQKLPDFHIKLPHSVIVKSPGLLPMLYTVRELAEEIAIPERTLRDWLLHGAPHTRDRLSHIWIDGQAFAAWITMLRKKNPGQKLQPDEGFCMRCQRVVAMRNPTTYSSNSRLVYIHGTCPICNGKVTRGAWHDQPQ